MILAYGYSKKEVPICPLSIDEASRANDAKVWPLPDANPISGGERFDEFQVAMFGSR
jgi:hypothetical protein